jgi:hypothetical protein
LKARLSKLKGWEPHALGPARRDLILG